jgi:phosphatidate cytidylyltransferase
MASTPTPAAALPADPGPAGGEGAAEGVVSRAGRNLPVAIVVGLGLGAVVLVPLYTDKAIFVGVVALTVSVGLYELARSVRGSGPRLPLPPLVAGAGLMVALAYTRGTSALVVGLLVTLLAVAAWEAIEALAHHPGGPIDPVQRLRSLAMSGFAAVYVPFMASFCVLLTAPWSAATSAATPPVCWPAGTRWRRACRRRSPGRGWADR